MFKDVDGIKSFRFWCLDGREREIDYEVLEE